MSSKQMSVVCNVYFPFGISILGVAISIGVDLFLPGMHWTQRIGSFMTVAGVYIAYFDENTKENGHNKNWSLRLRSKYTKFSLPCVIIGTILWGYGDLLL